MKTVGIIGGLGPETTSEFYLDIIFSCYEKNKEIRPGVLISSVPLPYQIEEDLILKDSGTERYVPFLVQETKRLEAAGADFLVMPCNSLHAFIQDLRDAVHIPVLSIVEATVRFLNAHHIHRVGIVSTATTAKNRLYEDALEAQGIACLIPNDLQQAKMGQFIHHLVMGQRNNRDREELIEIINEFEDRQVDCVILACTDLQLLIPKHPRLKIYDTMKIFADATVAEILK